MSERKEENTGKACDNMPSPERESAEARAEMPREKHTAAWLHYVGGLGEMVSFSAVAKRYFGKSPNWLLQRMHGYEVNGKKAMLKPEQYQVLTAALRDIAARLCQAADDIDAAADDGDYWNE